MGNIIINTIDNLEKLEKKQGMIGTIVGLLIIAVSLMASAFAIYLIIKFNADLINAVINHFWF